ncbi:MAG: hypothetical protein JWO67_6201 [Streptosporangiaceae bacterium]|jgi:hypothetical protein|nr:hypothetical protein [Streptosporangiaceae bacterium]
MAEARERLEKLAAALTEMGLRVRLVVGEPPLLHVVNIGPPPLQEQIGCCVNDGELWFQWTALQVFLGRAGDVPSAVERVLYVLHVGSEV